MFILLKVAEKTSDLYLSFDKESPILGDGRTKFHGKTMILPLPNRLSPVAYLPGRKGHYIQYYDFNNKLCIK